MKLMKTTARKDRYHTTECVTVAKLGRDKFVECTDEDIEKFDLTECGHCQGVERTNGDHSWYKLAQEAE